MAEALQQQRETDVPFKVFGLQRSGTNLMHKLVTSNFHVRYLDEPTTGWKHGPLRVADGIFDGQPARFALCVKNPYSWALSCYRYFQRCKGGDPTMDPQFRQDPSKSFEEFLMTPSYSFQSPIHRWNQMHRLWLATLPPDRTLIVRQEDQLQDQMRILQETERKLGLVRQSDQLRPIEEKVDVYLKTHGPMNRDYYLDRHYMAEYGPALLDRVNGLLDQALMEQLSYPLERWTLTERQIGPMKLIVRPCTSDAAEAREISFDPFHLQAVKQAGHEVKRIVDVGAGIGAWVAYAKSLWPVARVVAYEPCPEKVRLLRINGGRLADVASFCAAVAEQAGSQVPLASACPMGEECCHKGTERARATISTLNLDHAAARLGSIDLLRIGYSQIVRQVLGKAIGTGMIKSIRWVCGLVSVGQELPPELSNSHAVQTWGTPAAHVFLAERFQ